MARRVGQPPLWQGQVGAGRPAAAGGYQVTLLGGQVRDITGKAAPAADLGGFTARAPLPLRACPPELRPTA